MSSRLETAFYDLGRLDLLAEKDTRIHHLDPRVKVVTTIIFIIYVVSFNKYEIADLLPFFLFPALLIGLADLPFGYLLRKLLLVSPFVLFIGIFNPLLDKQIVLQIGSLSISGGWVSLASILLRFILTVSAALLLIATTGFPAICMALEKLGAPKIISVQLLMLYRYIFVLIEESIRMFRAYTLRSWTGKKPNFSVFKQLLGSLLLRTLDRAQRIHLAMLSRAFTGDIKVARQYNFGMREFLYLGTTLSLLTFFRFVSVSGALGKFFLELGL
jgi:cobalt/nickel transport system permease protein